MDNITFQNHAKHFVSNLKNLGMHIDQDAHGQTLADDLEPLGKIIARLEEKINAQTTIAWRDAVEAERSAIEKIVTDAEKDGRKGNYLKEIAAYFGEVQKPTDHEAFVQNLVRLQAHSGSDKLTPVIDDLKDLASNLTHVVQGWNEVVGKHYEVIRNAAKSAKEAGVNEPYPDEVLTAIKGPFNFSRDARHFANVGIFADWLNNWEGSILQGKTSQMDEVFCALKEVPSGDVDALRAESAKSGYKVLAALNVAERVLRAHQSEDEETRPLLGFIPEMRSYLKDIGVVENERTQFCVNLCDLKEFLKHKHLNVNAQELSKPIIELENILHTGDDAAWHETVQKSGNDVLATLDAVEKGGVRLPPYAKEIKNYLKSHGVTEDKELRRG
ncbi:MAG: hypothetical protein U1E36_00555 [Rickettsiales bacterium]